MIFYRPTDGDVHGSALKWRPRTCFLMSQLGGRVTPDARSAKRRIHAVLRQASIDCLDATSFTTGKDYLLKIWQLTATCPIGIAVVHQGIRPESMANIYYELGLMQAYGRETLVVRVGRPRLPSDLVRTEYLSFDDRFDANLRGFLAGLDDQAEHYRSMASQLERNPLLAIDYLRRAYLLTGEAALRSQAKRILADAQLEDRATNSVERLLTGF